MAKLTFNSNHEPDAPQLVLGTRRYERLGSIDSITGLSYEYYLMQPDCISFQVHKTDQFPLWDDIRDGRLVWLKEYNEWFQITVKVDETDETIKTVTGTSLCECELGQIHLVDTEINTEEDIGRENYSPTVFYHPNEESSSLLHRLLKKAPHYKIGHVDQTLWNLQRTFSISDTPVYDELTGEIAEEFGCLFLFDSATRTVHAYDLLSTCVDCGHRGEYTGSCPNCGNTQISEGYGKDTTILVDSENLSESISLEGRMDEVKNYFRVCGGDEIIDSYVAACNPSGANYIYALSNFDREDMSEELSARLDAYQSETAQKEEDYKKLVKQLYESISRQLELKSAMMPDIKHGTTTAGDELNKLTHNSLSPVAVANEDILKNLTATTANTAVLAMAKCLVNSTVYRVTITEGKIETGSDGTKLWKGKFKLVNQSDADDHAESTDEISCEINADYEQYVKDKIQKTIDRNDVYLVDLFDHKTSIHDFKNSLKDYCLERLISFENAYKSVIDVLIENEMADEAHETYNTLYKNYYEKLTAIQTELNRRNKQVSDEEKKYAQLETEKNRYNQLFSLPSYLSEQLYQEFCSYRREDVYKNDSYISDGLTDAELFEKAEELLETAKKEAETASVLHYTLSSTLYNLLAMEAFQPITRDFEGGNWIRVCVDNRIFKLRLIHYTIDFDNLQNLSVEFSDVTETPNGLSDVGSLMKQVQSMSTNFSYVAHQSSQGEKADKKINQILEDGLNAALHSIKNSDKQEIVIDSHGILGRRYDDITDDYSGEQFKLINNMLVFTDDNWKTAKTALGKIRYTHPLTKKLVEDYGLLAQAVITGILVGNQIVGGDIYSQNYELPSDKHTFEKGSHINLENGTFSFGDGSLKCEKNGDDYTLSFHGAVNITNKNDVKNDIGITGLEDHYSSLQSSVNTFQSIVGKSQKSWDVKKWMENGSLKFYGYGEPDSFDGQADGDMYLDQTTGSLWTYQGSDNAWNYTTDAKSIQETLQSQINQTAKSINQEVEARTNEGNEIKASLDLKINKNDAGTIISLIEGSADRIHFNANNFFTIDSPNFGLDENGNTRFSGNLSGSTINNGNGTFSVDKSGNLIAKSASIEGNLITEGIYGDEKVKTEIKDGKISFYDEYEKIGDIGAAYQMNGDYIHIDTTSKGIVMGINNEGYFFLNNGLNPNLFTDRHYFRGDTRIEGEFYPQSQIIFSNGQILKPFDFDINLSNTNYIYTDGNLSVEGKIECEGTKNRVVKTKNYGRVLMNAVESAGAYFSDFGSGTILEDTCYIYFDPVFTETIEENTEYQVFITPTSEGQVSYVEKQKGYFIAHGEKGAKFDWMMVCRQKGYATERMEKAEIPPEKKISYDMSVFYGEDSSAIQSKDFMESFVDDIDEKAICYLNDLIQQENEKFEMEELT